MKDLDELLKDIDALVDWQMTESPAAQTEWLVYNDDEDFNWTPEEVEEYKRDHPTELLCVADNGIRIFGVVCRCDGDECKYVVTSANTLARRQASSGNG